MAEIQAHAFRDSLLVGGACGRLIASRDWSSTSLDDIETWPESLRTATLILLRSPVPMVMLWGLDGVMLYNDAYAVFAGGRHPELLGSKVREGWPEVADFNDNVMRVGLAGGTLAYKDQELTLFRNGRPEQVWMDLDYSPVPDGYGRPAGVLCVLAETTERVASVRELKESEARLSAIFAGATVGLSEVGIDGRFLRVNDELCRILGRDEDEILRLRFVDVTHPEDVPPSLDAVRQAVRTGKTASLDKRYRRPDGGIAWVNSRVTRLRVGRGNPGNLLVVTVDLTERFAAEERLRASEELNRRILAASADCIKVLDLDARLEFMTEGGMCMMEVEDFDLVRGSCWPEFWQDEGRSQAEEAVEEARRGGVGRFRGFATTLKGTPRWWDVIVSSIDGPDGKPERLLSVSRDITATKQAEEALQALNADLEREVIERSRERGLIWQHSLDLLSVIDMGDGTIDAINPAWTAALGWTASEIEKRPYADFLHPEDVAASAAAFAHLQAGNPLLHFENRYRSKERGWRWLSWAVVPEGGKLYSITRDITEEKARRAELEAAQDALRQSQKMEAMGQLTGGVAHDFNNLLTPIVGSLDLLQRRGLGGEREQRLIAGAMQSAERAKTLVQRLLAFARRQPLQSVAIDIGKLVTGMGDLVASTTGPQIRVVVEAPDALPPALADLNQLEMALLNLAVNARDAMPDGGTLRISAGAETVGTRHRAKLRPGQYIRLSVADTGAGMDEATRARAVEPFFSTKGIGKGTGLGLSMVHGLTSQLGGALTIESRLGLGTNIELWLPQSTSAPEVAQTVADPPAAPFKRGTALLVDDEELVRMSTADMLADLGYIVVEAASGEEAMRLVNGGKPFDLLVTDHLMPGLTGTDLARAVRSLRPDVHVLLVSGYAESDGVAPDLLRLIKPFRKDELASSLDQLMNRRPDMSGPGKNAPNGFIIDPR